MFIFKALLLPVNDWTPNNVDLVFRHFIYTVKQIVKNKHWRDLCYEIHQFFYFRSADFYWYYIKCKQTADYLCSVWKKAQTSIQLKLKRIITFYYHHDEKKRVTNWQPNTSFTMMPNLAQSSIGQFIWFHKRSEEF